MEVFAALLLGFAPGLAWLAFFLKEDVHPEPKKIIAKVFIFGGLSAFIALALEMVFEPVLKSLPLVLPRLIEDSLSVFLGFAFIEEIIKFVFVYLVVRKSPYFDEPVDAMVYMITGALGFATAENIFLVFSQGDGGAFPLMVLRFIGATLLHALSSAIIGHFWAKGIKYKIEKKSLFFGLFLAGIFHTIFNYLVFKFDDLIIYPTVFLGLIGFFVLYDFEELRKMEEVSDSNGLPGN